MTRRINHYLIRTSLFFAVAAVLCGACAPVLAGEPIVFSDPKAKLDPDRGNKLNKLDQDRAKLWDPTGAPFIGPPPPALSRNAPFDSKKEKQRQNAIDERRNWMFLDPGELQQKESEEDSSGLQDDTSDRIEKRNGNYTFYNMEKAKGSGPNYSPGQPRTPGQKQKTGANQIVPSKNNEDLEEDAKRDSRSPNKRDSQTGAHTAAELDLRNLLDTSQLPAQKTERSEMTLRELLDTGSTSALSRDKQSEFNRFLNSSSQGSPLSGPLDPINLQPDRPREPINPVLARPAEPSAKSPEAFAPQTFGRPNNPLLGPGLADLYPARAAGAGGGSPSFLPSQEPPRKIQPPGFDIPRRQGLMGR